MSGTARRGETHRSARLREAFSTAQDVIHDAFFAVSRRFGKTVLAALGAAVGVGVLAATLSISAASDAHVKQAFDAIRPTEITAQSPDDPAWIQPGSLDRLRRYPGVTAAGVTTASDAPVAVSRLPGGWAAAQTATVVAVGGTGWDALGAVATSGRLFDDGSVERLDAVVVIGTGLARSLGISEIDGTTAITVAGRRLTVAGIAEPTDRGDPNVLLDLFVPSTQVLPGQVWRPPSIIVQTTPKFTSAVAQSTALLLRPDAPEVVMVQAPADPVGLRSAVTGDVRILLIALGAVCLVVGSIMIGSTTLMRVAERRPEIALRRALGASRLAIAAQVAIESILIGAAGGLAGAYLGQGAAAATSLIAGWPLTLNVAFLPAGLVLGGVIGGIAGLYPATRAARQDPADALRL